MRKSGGANNQLEYFKVELKDILVSSVDATTAQADGVEAGPEGSPWPNETVALNFAEFKVTYTPQTEQGGGGAQVEFGYNVAQNKTV